MDYGLAAEDYVGCADYLGTSGDFVASVLWCVRLEEGEGRRIGERERDGKGERRGGGDRRFRCIRLWGPFWTFCYIAGEMSGGGRLRLSWGFEVSLILPLFGKAVCVLQVHHVQPPFLLCIRKGRKVKIQFHWIGR